MSMPPELLDLINSNKRTVTVVVHLQTTPPQAQQQQLRHIQVAPKKELGQKQYKSQ
jgi:hypothetical protein